MIKSLLIVSRLFCFYLIGDADMRLYVLFLM